MNFSISTSAWGNKREILEMLNNIFYHLRRNSSMEIIWWIASQCSIIFSSVVLIIFLFYINLSVLQFCRGFTLCACILQISLWMYMDMRYGDDDDDVIIVKWDVKLLSSIAVSFLHRGEWGCINSEVMEFFCIFCVILGIKSTLYAKK